MKNIRILFIACVFPLWGLGGLNAQVTILDQGYCGAGGGTNLAWTLYSDSTLTISGSGYMMNCWDGFGWGDIAPWKNYRNQIKTVIIGDSVSSIEYAAFWNCSGLTSVTIGNSITIIETSAFGNCSNLTSVIIPNSVLTIGGAFYDCNSLTSVVIGNNVENITQDAFYGCINIKYITVLAIIPPIILGNYVFYNVPDTIPIYIPCESVFDYQIAWNYFSNFIGIPDTTIIYDTICYGTNYKQNGFTITNATKDSIYFNNNQNINNCDSITQLNLTINSKQDTVIFNDTICYGTNYTQNGFTIANAAKDSIYFNNNLNTNGCDSVTQLNLTINSKQDTVIFNDTICYGTNYTQNGFTIANATKDSIYFNNNLNINGCDSITQLNLTISGVGVTNYELRITNYELRITNYELRITNYKKF